MKDLRKIIALFIFIFITGIIITVVSINSTFNEKTSREIVTAKDSTLLIKSHKKTV